MRLPAHRFAAAAAAIVAASTLALLRPATVHACSAGPDLPVLDAAAVVVARGVQLELLELHRPTPFVSVRVTFEINRYLSGNGPSTLSVLDIRAATLGPHLARNSSDIERVDFARVRPEDLRWGGDGCSALQADPRGRTFVAGFWRRPDGELQMSRLMLFGTDAWPGPTVDEGVDHFRRLIEQAGPRPPRAGTAGLARHRANATTTVAGATLAFGLLAAGRRSTRTSASRATT